MPWNDVTWTSGVTAGGDETNLDNMQGDLSFVRGELNYRTVASHAGRSEGGFGYVGSGTAVDATWSVRLAVYGGTGSAAVSSGAAVNGSWAAHSSTVDVSGIPVGGLAEFSVRVEFTPPATAWTPLVEIGRFWYVRAADEDRVRVAVRLRPNANRKWFRPSGFVENGFIWCEAEGLTASAFRAGAGDPRWTAVTFDGPSPGPAELVSDTDMNAMHTNAEVIRDTLYGTSALCAALAAPGIDAVFTNLEFNHAQRFELYAGGTRLAAGASTGFSSQTAYVTRGFGVVLPQSIAWGLMAFEVRVQFANASSPNDWVGQDGGLDSPGWLLARGRFWKTPDDRYVHLRVASKDLLGYGLLNQPLPGGVVVRTLGVQVIATRTA